MITNVCITCGVPISYEDRQICKQCENHGKKPAADVVEVVRCKNCDYYKPYSKPVEDFDGKCIARECETDENEFCSYAVRKTRLESEE